MLKQLGSEVILSDAGVSREIESPEGVLADFLHSGCVMVCHEPANGRLAALHLMQVRARDVGATVMHLSVAGISDTYVRSCLTRLSASVCATEHDGGHAVVLIDGIPPHQELLARRVARAVARMVDAGAFVVCIIMPECGLLLDLCPDARVLYSADFIGNQAIEDERVARLSHGIPVLVSTCPTEASLDRQGSRHSIDGLYARELSQCVQGHFRETLAEEEVLRRLALLLLGSGSIDELRMVARHCDTDDLAFLERVAPLFGISASGESFEVAGAYRDDLLDVILFSMQRLIREHSALSVDAARALCLRGEMRRASLILRRLELDESGLRLALAFGVQFLFAGCRTLVQEALHHSTEIPELCQLHEYNMSKAAFELMEGRVASASDDAASGNRVSSDALSAERLRLLGETRRLLAGTNVRRSVRGSDAALCLGVSAMGRLLCGQTTEAYNELMDLPSRVSPRTVSDALACSYFYAATVLVGERVDPQLEESFHRSRELMMEASPRVLGPYLRSMPDALRILVGKAALFPGAEKVIARAESNGDVAAQAIFLMAAAVADLRCDLPMRAHARSRRAVLLVRRLKNHDLADAAHFVHEVVSCAMRVGVSDEEPTLGGSQDRSGSVARVLAKLVRSARVGAERLDVSNKDEAWGKGPCDALWMLNLLFRDSRIESHRLTDVLPKLWVTLYYERISTALDEEVAGELEVLAPPAAAEAPNAMGGRGKAIRVRVLGGCSVQTSWGEVDHRELSRRHAKELLTLLSLAKGHKVTRREALLSVWGEADYTGGMQKLYESVSQVRRALRVQDGGVEPIITSRTEGTIAFNAEVVECDVDLFLAAAREALGEAADTEVVAHAQCAWDLYQSGVSVALNDVTGVAGCRMRELDHLEENALCAGAASALALKRYYLVTKFAGEALRLNKFREDAMMFLVEALTELGRANEVGEMERGYRRHVRRGMRKRSEALEAAFRIALRACRGD